MIEIYDIVRSNEEISKKIPCYTIGVVLDISPDNNYLIVEFIDKDQNSLDGGATFVKLQQVDLIKKNKGSR